MTSESSVNKSILLLLFVFLLGCIYILRSDLALVATLREWCSGVLGALLMLMQVESGKKLGSVPPKDIGELFPPEPK